MEDNSDITLYAKWTVNKITPTVTAPSAKSLTYNGTAQTLITAGSTNGGTFQYKVGSGSYNTSLPTATNAGIYTVYYKVIGNATYADTAEKSISVEIKKYDLSTGGTVSGIESEYIHQTYGELSSSELSPVPTVVALGRTLESGVDYHLSYYRNGTNIYDSGANENLYFYKIETYINGDGNYTGSITVKSKHVPDVYVVSWANPLSKYGDNMKDNPKNVPGYKWITYTGLDGNNHDQYIYGSDTIFVKRNTVIYLKMKCPSSSAGLVGVATSGLASATNNTNKTASGQTLSAKGTVKGHKSAAKSQDTSPSNSNNGSWGWVVKFSANNDWSF